MEIENLIKAVIQCAYNVRIHLAAGFLENVYQKALIIELKEKSIHADTETPINVVNYLTATNTDHGLLINFGGERIEIKRKFREYKHKNYA